MFDKIYRYSSKNSKFLRSLASNHCQIHQNSLILPAAIQMLFFQEYIVTCLTNFKICIPIAHKDFVGIRIILCPSQVLVDINFIRGFFRIISRTSPFIPGTITIINCTQFTKSCLNKKSDWIPPPYIHSKQNILLFRPVLSF